LTLSARGYSQLSFYSICSSPIREIYLGTGESMSLVLNTETQQKEEQNENKLAHYAEAASVSEAYVLGTPVKALCGEIFIPSRDPEKFPVCRTCKDIINALLLSSD
jgi:hypothetical protein